ncbi:DNA repair protein RadC [Chryseolinea sp. T2]|uniref:RadC family protein n=1 Tax=Chryseolinea sp. T2 TaxID=3129255 RepID=UPI003077C952
MMTTEIIPLRDWSPQDLPREKLLRKGTSALSDAELISLLLGSGTRSISSVELGRRVLHHANNNLHDLARMSVKDLVRVGGIGHSKAMAIVAALELGRRRRELSPESRPRLSKSADAFDLLKPFLQDIPHEEFWIILVNRANRLIKIGQISQGGVAGTVADPKIIFKMAIEELASGIILAHNHPSGNITASQADIELTRKLSAGARLLEVQVLDHIILAGQKYFSFADEGMM